MGGEISHDRILFYRRSAQLSGFLIGLAVELAILSNLTYFNAAVSNALFLTLGLGLLLVLAFAKGNPFFQGLIISGVFTSVALLSKDLRPIMQMVIALPFLGALEIMLFIIAGRLIVRS